MRTPALLLALAAVVLAIGADADFTSAGSSGKIYWAGLGRIGRANLDGSDPEELLSGLSQPEGIALDVAAGKVYWTAQGDNFGDGKIQRADLDGSNIETVLAGLGAPSGVALDVDAGKMYWRESDRIRRADLNGTGVEDVVSFEATSDAIAVDLSAGKVYWSSNISIGVEVRQAIWRANVDGSGVEALVTEGLDFPVDIALDVEGGKMYWTDPSLSRIQRANLDGTGVEDVVVALEPRALAVDPAGGKVYWSNGATISRAGLDGSDAEELLAPPALGQPGDIALALVGLPGDANCDGAVTSVDAALALQFGARLIGTLPCRLEADVNGDGRTDAIDALLILQLEAGLIESFPGL